MTTFKRTDWPVSTLEADLLHEAVGKFLRTHRDGGRALVEWMGTNPPDRTEAQFAEEQRQAAERKATAEASIRDALANGASVEDVMQMQH